MVHKKHLNRVHSGNTLRASNSTYNRRYNRQGCLIRHMNEGAKAIRLLDELNIGENDVAYSLNKKGRWVVPKILKDQILHNPKMQDYTTGITLIESHKLKKESRCISYCSSKGPVEKMVPKKSKTYFNVSSVPKHDEPKEKDMVPNVAFGECSETIQPVERPEITVNVLYPCPKSSSITHNPKYIRFSDARYKDEADEEQSIFKVDGSFTTKSRTNNRQRKRISLSGESKDILFDLEDVADNGEDYTDDASPKCNVHTYSLGDVLQSAKKQTLSRSKRSSKTEVS